MIKCGKEGFFEWNGFKSDIFGVDFELEDTSISSLINEMICFDFELIF